MSGGAPAQRKRRPDPPPATTADPRSTLQGGGGAGRDRLARRHLGDPEHFMVQVAWTMGALHRAASARERGER
jgi:hypothetical protein